VLIGDKNEPDAFLIDFLKFYGYEVKRASDVNELRVMLKATVDAVLVDVERSGPHTVQVRDFMLRLHSDVALCSISSPGVVTDFPRAVTKPLLPMHLRALLEDLRYHRTTTINRVVKVSDDIAGKKVLVVEDNKGNQMVMSKMLTKLGVRFKIAENGQIALDVLEGEEFDMVFMDCQMPVMDGLEATRNIRASNQAYQQVPIVALTASAIEGDEEHCRQGGMDGYLTKPVRLEQITQAVKKYAT
jgi:CheY-like chemotaxis protein